MGDGRPFRTIVRNAQSEVIASVPAAHTAHQTHLNCRPNTLPTLQNIYGASKVANQSKAATQPPPPRKDSAGEVPRLLTLFV